MSDLYEYRRQPNRGAIWLACVGVIVLLSVILLTGADDLMPLVWILAAVTVAWMVLPKRPSGIRIDDTHLILSAWHTPRPILLDDIAYLRVTEDSLESDVAIVFKTGEEEGVYASELPDIDTLIVVMAERGIPVRDVV